MTLNKSSKYIIAYNESAIYAAECFAKVIKEFIRITHKKFSIGINMDNIANNRNDASK